MDHVSIFGLLTALDTQRATRGMSWRDIGRELGLSNSTFTKMRAGNGIGVDGYAECCRWLGVSLDTFLTTPRTPDSEDRPGLAIELVALLHHYGLPEMYWQPLAELILTLAACQATAVAGQG